MLPTELTDYLTPQAASFLSDRFIRDPNCQVLLYDVFDFLIRETSRLPKLIARILTGEIVGKATVTAIQTMKLLREGKGDEQLLRPSDDDVPRYQKLHDEYKARWPDRY